MTYLEEVDGKSITVRNIEYTIEVLSGEEMNEQEGETTLGVCSPSKGLITIRDGMNDDRAHQTLIHELTHAMFFESGYTFDSDDQHEAINEALSLVIQDMVNTGGLVINFNEQISFEAIDMLAKENDKKIYIDSVQSAELNGEELYAKQQPLFKLPKLFKAPQFFWDNKPNMSIEDESNKSENLNMFLVKTLWNTYTVNTYGKNRIESAIHNNLPSVQVYDFQTTSRQVIKIMNITEVVPLKPTHNEKPNMNFEKEPEDAPNDHLVTTTKGVYRVSQYAYDVLKLKGICFDAFDLISEEYIDINSSDVIEVCALQTVPFKEEN